MWAVARCLHCSEDSILREYLYVDSEKRVFWTAWESEITLFDDLEEAFKFAESLNYLYGFDICGVTTGPLWTPEVIPCDA